MFAILLFLCYDTLYYVWSGQGRKKELENHSQPQIRISVRNLVEFVMRSGDLDNRRTAGAKKSVWEPPTVPR